jgi:hypothetical protein
LFKPESWGLETSYCDSAALLLKQKSCLWARVTAAASPSNPARGSQLQGVFLLLLDSHPTLPSTSMAPPDKSRELRRRSDNQRNVSYEVIDNEADRTYAPRRRARESSLGYRCSFSIKSCQWITASRRLPHGGTSREGSQDWLRIWIGKLANRNQSRFYQGSNHTRRHGIASQILALSLRLCTKEKFVHRGIST